MSDPDPATIWHRFRTEAQRAVSESTWHIWLERVGFRELAGTTLVLEAPDDVRSWVETRFTRLLNALAETVIGPGARVDIVGPQEQVEIERPRPEAQRAQIAQELNPRLTFDQFVIGDCNRLAHAAALAVAEMPGLAYNPLFICGPPGLGKTHLLHSIANYVHEHGAGLTARYTTVEAFTDHFVGALKDGGMEAFKAAYRGVDVLLVDDVQFLQSRAKTEQEFFHTFNALHQAGAQLVLTSDRPPRDLEALEDRLRERFEAGLVCDVKPPERATRLTVLRKRVAQDDVGDIDPQALELIADRVATNLRALEGALIRVVAFGSLTGRPVTPELANEVLDGLYPQLKPKVRSVKEIQEQTCAAFGITMDDLLSSTRTQPVAFARQVAMYLSRELTDVSLPAIGRAFGNRNHTTVMHACKRTAERIATDKDAYEAVRKLTRELGGE
ncbi:chromosomal replication initiator protein DnaA [Solirubrobacter ginsenosidimutans]|uniref:Chromosomal replication initiator protein DnaA n=1 Tax=Solirubrobacter ginsenosidimutans TaxID=490573 RepID=A0A9X3MTB0_9ACTN|nr:chromosomal replication initiator protein DnaA [Solirubrobacter ginsenosidimutans]MDA0162012.1 chromosomal replication initiator protein DnaA [Solirubrobacter ginsenosidimutans]